MYTYTHTHTCMYGGHGRWHGRRAVCKAVSRAIYVYVCVCVCVSYGCVYIYTYM